MLCRTLEVTSLCHFDIFTVTSHCMGMSIDSHRLVCCLINSILSLLDRMEYLYPKGNEGKKLTCLLILLLVANLH